MSTRERWIGPVANVTQAVPKKIDVPFGVGPVPIIEAKIRSALSKKKKDLVTRGCVRWH